MKLNGAESWRASLCGTPFDFCYGLDVKILPKWTSLGMRTHLVGVPPLLFMYPNSNAWLGCCTRPVGYFSSTVARPAALRLGSIFFSAYIARICSGCLRHAAAMYSDE